MSRWKAGFLHLGISIAIAVAVVAALLLVWYPPPLFSASGLEQFLLILLGVDVVIGPVLTLIVFRSGKKGLKLDLALIACAQVLALVYGLYVMWSARPVYIVAAVDRFTVITAPDMPQEFLDAARDTPYAGLPAFGAKRVGARPPQDAEARYQLTSEVLKGAKDIEYRPAYYVEYAQVAEAIAKRGRDVEHLIAHYGERAGHVAELLARERQAGNDLVYVPMRAPRRSVTVLLRSPSGEVLNTVDLDPWAVVVPEAASQSTVPD